MTFQEIAHRDGLMKTPAHLEALIRKPFKPSRLRVGVCDDESAPVQQHNEPTPVKSMADGRSHRLRRTWLSHVRQSMGVRGECFFYEVIDRIEREHGIDRHGLERRDYKKHPERVSRLLSIFATWCGMSMDDFKGSGQERCTAKPRQLFMWLMDSECKLSRSAIGRFFNRDHSTVLYALRVVNSDEVLLYIAKHVRSKVLKIEAMKFGLSVSPPIVWDDSQKFTFELSRHKVTQARRLLASGLGAGVVAKQLHVSRYAITNNMKRIKRNADTYKVKGRG